jgi:hypothetical protein
MRFAIALAMLALLQGCVGLLAAGSAAGALGSGFVAAQEIATLTGDVLTDSAKLACAIQAVANAEGDTPLSKAAGSFCAW